MTLHTVDFLEPEFLIQKKKMEQLLPLEAATGGYGITVTSAPALKRQKGRVTGRSDATAVSLGNVVSAASSFCHRS